MLQRSAMTHVVLEGEGPVRTLRLARPEKKNALSQASWAISAWSQPMAVDIIEPMRSRPSARV